MKVRVWNWDWNGRDGRAEDEARRLWAIRPRKRARGQCGDGHVGNQLVWLLRPLPEGWRALLEPGSRVRMAARGLRVVALLTGDVPLDDDGLVSSRKIHRDREAVQ